MKIVLDAGHGFNTPGKRTPDGMREWEFNSVVASYVANELKEYENVQTLRVDDVTGVNDVLLGTRTSRANAWGANVYVSIHANAFGNGVEWTTPNGIETFVYKLSLREAFQLAKLVQENLIKDTKRTDRGVKEANFQVLRETKMTAILVECGFMTNKEEAALLKSDVYRKKCASAIVKGLVTMYGLKKKPTPAPVKLEVKPEPKKESEPFMLEKAIVINTFADYPAAERVAKKINAPIYTREVAEKGHQAKELIVCGGFVGKLKATKITDLSGKTLFDTFANIGQYLK